MKVTLMRIKIHLRDVIIVTVKDLQWSLNNMTRQIIKHEIEVPSWKYDYYDFKSNQQVEIFLEDITKSKYEILDIIKIKDKDSDKYQSRIVKETLLKDEGLKDGYIMLQLGEVADFDNGCIGTAVFGSLGKTRKA